MWVFINGTRNWWLDIFPFYGWHRKRDELMKPFDKYKNMEKRKLKKNIIERKKI